MANHNIHPSAEIESGVDIGIGTAIWDNTRIRFNAKIGSKVMIGRNVFIDHDVVIGSDTRIQNNSLIYYPAVIGEGVFIGPGVIITNDRNPRSSYSSLPDRTLQGWELAEISIRKGASLGANVVCVGPLIIGEWSMIGAGCTLVNDAVAFGLYVGVPAKRIGWVGHAGYKLIQKGNSNVYSCPKSNRIYIETEVNKLSEVQ